MSPAEKKAFVRRDHPDLSVSRQCRLLKLSRSALFYTPAVIALRGVDVVRVPLRAWGPGFLSAAASYLAYAIVVWAMTKAPIAVVSALRETSILFAVLMGWAFFGEKMGAQKIVAALLIVAGVILTRL